MKEIIESNKLIAEFMGLIYIPFNDLQGFSIAGWWKKPIAINKENSIGNHVYLASKDSKSKIGSNRHICRTHNELRYFSSWSWLMPVIEKIESLDCSKFSYSWEQGEEIYYNFTYPNVEIIDKNCWIYFDLQLDPCMTIADIKEGTKIKACYEAVVEFIKWYNEVSKLN